MRLLFLNHNVAFSGTFFRVFQLGRALTERGHEVTVVTTSPRARLRRDERVREGVRLIEMPDLLWGRARTGWDGWNVLNRALGLSPADFDVVHGFDCRPAVILPALHLARRGDLPLFLDWADWWGRGGAIGERPGRLVNALVGPLETWFEEAFRRHAVGTTVISRALERRAVALGVPADSVLRFPNGCEHEKIVPGDRARARAGLGLDEAGDTLLHVGTVYPRDLALMLAAFQRVLRERPAARLVMVGNPRAPIPAGVVPEAALHATGFVDFAALQAWLAAADCGVIPLSDTVGNRGRWPGKVNDFLCAGRAVVMPRVGDAAEWIAEGRAGWTAPADADGLARALLTALGAPEEAQARGERGRTLAETRLAWSTLAARVDEFYMFRMSVGVPPRGGRRALEPEAAR